MFSEWLTCKQAAKRLGCKKKTIEFMVSDGLLSGKKVEGKRRVKAYEVKQLQAAVKPTKPLRSSAPLVVWPPSMRHTSEEDELLRQLYAENSSHQSRRDARDRSIKRVMIKEELPGGFSGNRVLVVIPVGRSNLKQATRVVKLGSRVMLETEHGNYVSFVEDYLLTAVASKKRFTVRGNMAAIEYFFVGGGLLGRVCDLTTYYMDHSASEIEETLSALLRDHLGSYWYKQRQLQPEHLVAEYGPHLPALIILKLRSRSDDRLWSKDDETIPKNVEEYRLLKDDVLQYDLCPAEEGELVQINGLKVVRIKPWAATLAHAQEDKEDQIRVRVEYKQGSDIAEQMYIGQRVVVRGQVRFTRQGLLERVVQIVFRDCSEVQVSPNDDQVLTGLGRGPHPNPLKLYPASLDELFDVYRSVIHGDLHPRNVLVDQLGRPWLIDFGRVREGHTLFDFIKLETYLRLDVLSDMSSLTFTLAQYVQFEEALADATLYDPSAIRLPTNPDLLKAFHVILAIRRLAKHYHPEENQQDRAKTYFHCLMLFNLAVLKYARRVLDEDGSTEEQNRRMQGARLCFVAAAIQGRWIKNPPPPP
jgi:excisionase family DNA binding protein